MSIKHLREIPTGGHPL